MGGGAQHAQQAASKNAISRPAASPVANRALSVSLARSGSTRSTTTTWKARAGYWPPLIAPGKPVATGGAKASLLGTTKRADGRLQVTYNHHPLYTFVKDTGKGQTNGEEIAAFGAEWYALSPAGTKVENNQVKSSSEDSSAPAASGYGYGY